MRFTFLCLRPRVHVETAVWHIIRSFSDLCQQVYENNNVLIVWLHHRPRWSEILADINFAHQGVLTQSLNTQALVFENIQG